MASRQHPYLDPDLAPSRAEVGELFDVLASRVKRRLDEAEPDA